MIACKPCHVSPPLQVKKEKNKPEKNKPEKLKEKAKLKEKVKPKEKKLPVPAAKVPRKVDKNLARRQEERQRQQMILEEMKKPTEDMCLGDHQVHRIAWLFRGWETAPYSICLFI